MNTGRKAIGNGLFSIWMGLSVLALSAWLMACPSPVSGTNPTPSLVPGNDPGNGTNPDIIPASWWGPYQRMDNGAAFYVAASKVQTESGAVVPSAATAEKITTAAAIFERVANGNGLTKVTQGSTVFYIYPKERRNGTFSGTVAGVSAASGSVHGRGLGGIAGITAIIKNANNPADTQTVTTNASGTFQVPDAIPGDTYVVVPQTTGGTAVSVKPLDSGTDIGQVSVVDTGYNFKTSTDYNNAYLFADGSTEWPITVTVTNNGSTDSPSPIWTASETSTGITITGTKTSNLQTIPAGGSRSFNLKVRCNAISGDYEDKTISISLAIYQGGTWEDRLTLRFWKDDRLTVNLVSQYGNQANIITTDGRLVGFNSSATVPRKNSGTKVLLSGATNSTETKYALAVGYSETIDWDATVVSPGIDEPNDQPAQATPLYINDPSGKMRLGYLRPNEMDYFEIMSAGLPQPTGLSISRPDVSHVSLSWNPVAGAEKYYVYINDVLQTTSGTSSTSLTGVSSSSLAPTLKVIAWAGTVGYGLPATKAYFTMVSVAGGSFSNGTATVTLTSYKMSAVEITQGQYQAIIGQNPSGSYYGWGPDYPVNQVSWYDTLVFCNKLSLAEGKTPVYSIGGSTDPASWGVMPTSTNTTWDAASMNMSASGYRLPTEAEWEFAARGGNSTNNYTYAGSNTIDTVAWYNLNGGSTCHSVGGKTANELGLYDMSGNVWEWCWDWYGNYASGSQSDPTGASSGFSRVYRGGGWDIDAGRCAVSYRYDYNPPIRSSNFGFRVVCR